MYRCLMHNYLILRVRKYNLPQSHALVFGYPRTEYRWTQSHALVIEYLLPQSHDLVIEDDASVIQDHASESLSTIPSNTID